GKHSHRASDDDCIRSLESGVDRGGSAGGSNLNGPTDQGACHRLTPGELNHFQVFVAILFEVTSFLGGPKWRLGGTENGSGSEGFLGQKLCRREQHDCRNKNDFAQKKRFFYQEGKRLIHKLSVPISREFGF